MYSFTIVRGVNRRIGDGAATARDNIFRDFFLNKFSGIGKLLHIYISYLTRVGRECSEMAVSLRRFFAR